MTALARDGVVARMQEEEARLGDRIPAFDAIQGELRRVLDAKRATRERDAVLAWMATASPLLEQAEKLVRLAQNRTRPDLERDEATRPAISPTCGRGWSAGRSRVEPGSDRRGLRIFLLERHGCPPTGACSARSPARRNRRGRPPSSGGCLPHPSTRRRV